MLGPLTTNSMPAAIKSEDAPRVAQRDRGGARPQSFSSFFAAQMPERPSLKDGRQKVAVAEERAPDEVTGASSADEDVLNEEGATADTMYQAMGGELDKHDAVTDIQSAEDWSDHAAEVAPFIDEIAAQEGENPEAFQAFVPLASLVDADDWTVGVPALARRTGTSVHETSNQIKGSGAVSIKSSLRDPMAGASHLTDDSGAAQVSHTPNEQPAATIRPLSAQIEMFGQRNGGSPLGTSELLQQTSDASLTVKDATRAEIHPGSPESLSYEKLNTSESGHTSGSPVGPDVGGLSIFPADGADSVPAKVNAEPESGQRPVDWEGRAAQEVAQPKVGPQAIVGQNIFLDGRAISLERGRHDWSVEQPAPPSANGAGADTPTLIEAIPRGAAPPALVASVELGRATSWTSLASARDEASLALGSDASLDTILVAEARLASLPSGEPRLVPSLLQGSEGVRNIAAQMAEAMAKAGADRAIDVILNPAELGRVRITLAQGEAGIVVNISADRGETLDLMRRHSDMLGRELQDLGYNGTEFSFSRDGRGRAPHAAQTNFGADVKEPAGPLTHASDSARAAGTVIADRLDIRL
ncbi:flagellar hook-length control protein FliK [Roseovarius nanhaiticus]|uniref:flagellar hook-length control protein FliK n=1 Tax=Roseovarius nanhaiticus TaxID=573024 RepID=UPI00249161A9|nr:flagellar hook-length control protein FliK [Roseovarius nanhaiticus]